MTLLFRLERDSLSARLCSALSVTSSQFRLERDSLSARLE